MADLELTFTCTPYDRVMPLITGEVKPVGIKLHYLPVSTGDIFPQQIKFSRFDVSEMSFAGALMGRAQGWGYRQLPVFHNRGFGVLHQQMMVRLSSGIRVNHPEDLKGKRVGIPDYVQTSGLWIRGILQHEFGVLPEVMEWYQGRPQRYSLSAATNFALPSGLRLHYTTTDFGSMLLAGQIDAVALYLTDMASSMDRPNVDISGNPDFTYLFSDRMAECVRLYRSLGFVPASHTTVVRESVLREHPWVATSLLQAFQRAKKLAVERFKPFEVSLIITAAQRVQEERAIFGDDPHPYGIRVNAKLIDTMQTYALEQGLTDRKQPLEELFAEEVLLAEDIVPG